ncbi:hypothetical protein FRC12_019768 [Ceratobasidium sp. 428]|nr:hypothetical protein FRC12_019768 [Ceratobasidium sp. 428]
MPHHKRQHVDEEEEKHEAPRLSKKEQMKQIQPLQTDLQESDEHIARLEEDTETLRQQLEDHGGEDQDHHPDSDAPSKAEIKLMKKAARGWISRAPRIYGAKQVLDTTTYWRATGAGSSSHSCCMQLFTIRVHNKHPATYVCVFKIGSRNTNTGYI